MTLVHLRLQSLAEAKSPLPPFVKGGNAKRGRSGSQGLRPDLPAPCVKGESVKWGGFVIADHVYESYVV
jgi:hypothetical protein